MANPLPPNLAPAAPAVPQPRGPVGGDHLGFVRDAFVEGNLGNLEVYGASDRERQTRQLEVGINGLAQARYDLWSGAGNPDRDGHGEALGEAQHYLDGVIGTTIANENGEEGNGLSERDAIIARFRVMEAVADRQVAIAGEHNPEHLQAQAPGRVMRALARLRRLSPWVAGALIAAGLTMTVISGGLAAVPAALLAAVPHAAAYGSAAALVASVPGAVAGNRRAAHARGRNNTAAATRARVDDELAEMHNQLQANLQHPNGPDYEAFRFNTNNFVHHTAMGERQRNTRARRDAILGGAGRAAVQAGWRAGLIGLGGGLVVGGVEALSGGPDAPGGADAGTGGEGGAPNKGGGTPPVMTPEQQAQAAEAWLRQNDAGWTELTNESAAGYTDGDTLWAKVQNYRGYSDSMLEGQYFPNHDVPDASALERLVAKGVDVKLGGQWSMTPDGIAVSGDGTQGWVESMSADHYVISTEDLEALRANGTLPEDMLHLSGELTQAKQAMLIDFEGSVNADGGHDFVVLSRDEILDLASQHDGIVDGQPVAPSGAEAPVVSAEQFAEMRETLNNVLNDYRARIEGLYGVAANAVDAASAQVTLNATLAQQAAEGVFDNVSANYFPYIAGQLSDVTGVPADYIADQIAARAQLTLAA